MGHTIQLEVPEDVYASLVRSGRQTGREPEAVAADLLATASRSLVDDPVERFIGAFPSNVADWGEEHDKYLGRAIRGDDADDVQGGGRG
ncbi:MAG TPA: hypothetical protein VLA19_09935 [Herpetosiphonaceae bacterium]|nr:hypothetical protein [Herpetosiphonaceae bacterium]